MGEEQVHENQPDSVLPEDESQSRVKEERKAEDVPKSEVATAEVKEESGDHDSEDSFRPEHVVEELHEFPPAVNPVPQPHEPREGATAPETPRESDGPYAPRRSTRYRDRPVSPDPLMFHTTIWLEHDQDASAHEEPIAQMRQQMSTMQANLETLRTRVGQIGDLCDAQGLREGQRSLTARLTEVEGCTSVQMLREFTHRIMRLESLVGGNHGGVLGEATRACHLRLDNQNAMMDEFHARIRTQDWHHDLSEQEGEEEVQPAVARSQDANGENQPGAENRSSVRHRARDHAAQRRVQRPNPRPPQVLRPLDEGNVSDATIQQRIQRLHTSYHQCVTRVDQVGDRLEQFRAAIRQDALELALTVQRMSQDLQNQGQSVEQIRNTLYNTVRDKVDNLDNRFQRFTEFTHSISATIDKNEHEICSSIGKINDEQADVRRLVEERARCLDHTQEMLMRHRTNQVWPFS